MNIVISVNDAYVNHAKVMLFSLCRHTQEDVCVYLLNRNLSRKQCAKFSLFLEKKCHASLYVLDMDEMFDDMPTVSSQFSVEMYYRLIAQFVLPNDLSRALWMDADIVVLRDLSIFYNQCFEDSYYVVCEDGLNGKFNVDEIKLKLGLNLEQKYFNSGVLLMNLDELRKDTSIDAIFTYCQKYKDRIKYPDQDLLNVMYAHNVKYADWKKYNFQLHIYDNSTQSNDEIEDVVILHYTGRVKPWQLNRYTKFDRFYWKEMFLSGKQGEAVFGQLLSITIELLKKMYRRVVKLL